MKLQLDRNLCRTIFATWLSLALIGGIAAADEVIDGAANEVTEAVTAETGTNETTVATAPAKTETRPTQGRTGRRREAVVVFGNNATLKEGDSTEAFVVIGGNGVVKGKVRHAAVVIGGNLDVWGEVGEAAVAVLGNVTVHTNAAVRREVVSVGGHAEVADGAKVGGQVQGVDFGAIGLPKIDWLVDWFQECALKLRPLSLRVGWIWIVAGIYLLIYMGVAVVLPKPVAACLAELNRRPVTTIFMGLLTKLLVPIVMIILVITVIGIIVVPFLSVALMFGSIIGKVALLQYFGQAIRRATGATEPLKPVVALLVGALVLTGFYLIPVLGLITYWLTGLWGMGIAATTAFGGMKRERPVRPAQPPIATPPPTGQPGFITPMPVMSPMPPAQNFTPGESASSLNPTAQPNPPTFVPTPTPTNVPEAYAYPRAGFWERMGAGFLDIVIVGILSAFVENTLRRLGHFPFPLIVTLAYFSGMWAWKGSTIGGLVLNLKVVRLDGGPVTFAVALVRGLGAALSVIVMFLGFFWIAWDQDKQGWHDRLAGTVVIRVPRAAPLVVL